MQRGGPEAPRGPAAKRGGGGKRSGGASLLSLASSPVAAAALFALLLFYSAHRFSSLASHEQGGGGPGFLDRHGSGAYQRQAGGGAASAVGAADDGLDPSLLLEALDGQHGQQDPERSRRSGWLSAALLWAEEHRAARVRAMTPSHQLPTGCGVLPCQSAQLQRPRTLVIYVYHAADVEQQRSFDFFLRHGMEEQPEWLTYRIVLAAGTGILPAPRLPPLPSNAAFIRTSQCTSGVWGILSAVAGELQAEAAAAQHIVVVSSAARGPFMPPYTKQHMHWTDALTSKLTKRTKLVGSALTCEGAPKGGDAADEWRLNPFILPYAWATDQEGWRLLTANSEVFQCHANAWESRYWADAGASLALLSAGFNIDCLLAKYQGVDWWNQRTWDCNARVRPDAEWTYDGVSISPFETVFVPVSQGPAQSDWSYVRQALKYSQWLEAQTTGSPQGNSNVFVSEAWTLRAQRMIFMNTRGPGCFDFDFYVQHNTDLAGKGSMHQLLWEHFVLVGQFQGRPHRFTCPVQIGTSYRSAYLRARGRRCFDHNHYSTYNQDLRLAGMSHAYELFNHYADFGQFENRVAKFVCSDSVYGLLKGFDSRPLDPLMLTAEDRSQKKWQGLVQGATEAAEAGLARLQRQQGGTARGEAVGGADAAGTGQQQQGLQQAHAQAAAAKQAQEAAEAEAEHQRMQAAAAMAAGNLQQAADAAAAAAEAAARQAEADRQQAAAEAAAAAGQATAGQAGVAAAGQAAAETAGQAVAAAGASQQQATEAAAAAAAAGGAADQGAGAQAVGGAGAEAEAVGDAADVAAAGRLEAAQAEDFDQQQAMQAAAGGA